MFVFDYLTERALYIELSEIIPGRNLKKAFCSISEGEAPKQILEVQDVKQEAVSLDMGESFYGDENFDMDELDKEGFDGLDDLDISSDAESGDLY